MFKKQNVIQYINGENAANISQRIIIPLKQQELQHYFVQDYKKPEQISLDLYDTPNYHWTILLVNNIINPFHNWPLSNETLVEVSKNKYNDIYATHHYLTADGYIVDELTTNDYDTNLLPIPPDVLIVSNIDYEIELNNKKRDIVVIKPKFVKNFVNKYEKIQESLRLI
ncbi:MAG: baseplate wedge protein 53 [Flavobacterium sp.]|uniref:baseplate wedge protein 53 n=1 Tax=Flavobacterium sp. TaxID=239 RepID=UPI002612DE32|nr:baseplate wedge protein 53 [Flavobacterium sp.]MDD5150012.1 baseplate wedge protein 53 [Flavobacterium sp.]